MREITRKNEAELNITRDLTKKKNAELDIKLELRRYFELNIKLDEERVSPFKYEASAHLGDNVELNLKRELTRKNVELNI